MNQDRMLPPDVEAPNQINRRLAVKGAAWSVPVIAMATAAPGAVASIIVTPEVPPLALNGWLLLTGLGDYRIRAEGAEAGDQEAGIYVDGTVGTETIGNASVTLYATRPVGTWVAQPGSSGLWTTPTYIGTNIVLATGQTVYGYRTTYTGPWVVAAGRSYASDIGFDFITQDSAGNSGISIWARRSVDVDGVTIHYDRGPINWWY